MGWVYILVVVFGFGTHVCVAGIYKVNYGSYLSGFLSIPMKPISLCFKK